MKKILIILLSLAIAVALVACETATDDESSVPPAESSEDTPSIDVPSTPDTESSEDFSDDISTIGEDYFDIFYEQQIYTSYYDVVKRVYTSSRKTDYTDYYGLADSNKNMLCICKYGTYLEPVRAGETVVPNRFITKNGDSPVIVTEKGVILNNQVLTSVIFPSKLSRNATYQSEVYIRGIATLEDGKTVLITADGVISDAYDSVTFVDDEYYLCIQGSIQSKLTLGGDLIAQVNSEYTEYSTLDVNRIIKTASSWDGVIYSVFDAEGNIILDGAKCAVSTPDIEYFGGYDWLIYTRDGVKEIYKSGVLISAYYSDITCVAGMPAAIAGAKVTNLDGSTAKLYCLIGSNAQTLYNECFESIAFLDADMIQVVEGGTTNEYFISQLTPYIAPVEFAAAINAHANSMYALVDLNADTLDELIVVSEGITNVYLNDSTLFAHGTQLCYNGTDIAFRAGDVSNYAYTVYGTDGSAVLYGSLIDTLGNTLYYSVANPDFDYAAYVDGVCYIGGDITNSRIDLRANKITYEEFASAVGTMHPIRPMLKK